MIRVEPLADPPQRGPWRGRAPTAPMAAPLRLLVLACASLLLAGCHSQRGLAPQGVPASPPEPAAQQRPAEDAAALLAATKGPELAALLGYYRRSVLLPEDVRREQLAGLISRLKGDECSANRVRAAALLTRAADTESLERAQTLLAPCLGYPIYVSEPAEVAAAPIAEVVSALKRAGAAERKAREASRQARAAEDRERKSTERAAILSQELQSTQGKLRAAKRQLERTNERLRAAHRKLNTTTEKLEDVKTIERSIQRREQQEDEGSN